jgi:hypothetical protein
MFIRKMLINDRFTMSRLQRLVSYSHAQQSALLCIIVVAYFGALGHFVRRSNSPLKVPFFIFVLNHIDCA